MTQYSSVLRSIPKSEKLGGGLKKFSDCQVFFDVQVSTKYYNIISENPLAIFGHGLKNKSKQFQKKTEFYNSLNILAVD